MAVQSETKKISTFEISRIGISLSSPDEIRKESVFVIENPHTIGTEGLAIPFGLSDSRLGAINKAETCRTCSRSFKDCKGHFGTIELEKPVFNILFLKQISRLLSEFCHICSSAVVGKSCPSCNHTNLEVEVSSIGLFYREEINWPYEEVREFLSKISNEDLEKSGLFKNGIRPEWTITYVIPVPSLKTRPTIFLENGGRAEDDLTYKLIDIIKTNLKIKSLVEQDLLSPVKEVAMLLQYHYVTYLDNSMPRVPISKHRNQRPLRCLSSRISGKEGRIRYNLGGKRTNHSARGIIVPDNSLEINEVGIPEEIANSLTKKVLVTEENIKEIEKELLKENTKIRYVYTPEREAFKVLPELKKDLLSKIIPGVIIKRSLCNGDYCLFNRQPSLHRHSIQGHKIKITPEKRNVFSINPLVCYPYNADFDGDEMNLHILQDADAEIELKERTDVKINAVSEKSGYPILGLTKDYISGLYLLSTHVEKINLSLFYPYLTDNKNDTRLLTGGEIISLCLPKDFSFDRDGIKISNNTLVGVIKKKHFAPQNSSIGYFLLSQYGSVRYTEIITLLSRLACIFEDYIGITVPLSFFNLEKEKEISKRIDKLKLELQTEMEKNPEVINLSQKFRNEIESEYNKILIENKVNNILVSSGSSGSPLNITQIYATIGQQNTHNGILIDNPLLPGIVYPFYRSKEKLYEARGLITNSYKSGLSEVEYFNHCIAGRESIVDSHIKTSISGYFQRRLINALADIHTGNEGFTVDSEQKIYQFIDSRFFNYIKTSLNRVKEESREIANQNKGEDKIKIYSFYPKELKEHLSSLSASKEGCEKITDLIRNSIVPNKTPIGILGSQAIGEPATQLTLRSFHHAGVGELDIVQGIEKIILVTSLQFRDKENQRIMIKLLKNIEEIKKILLVDIEQYFSLIPNLDQYSIILKQKKELSSTNKESYIAGLKLLFRSLRYNVEEISEGISISCKKKTLLELKKILEVLSERFEGGFYEERQESDEIILIGNAASLLKKILLLYPNSVSYVTTNLLEVEKIEGIEEARKRIITTLNEVFEDQGTIISYRYLSLLADTMSRQGELKPLSRTGIISGKDSFLARAAFESTVPIFVSSSAQNKKDPLRGVIERILVNKEVSLFQ